MANQLQINPWTGIWVRTRETIRAIIQFNPNYMYPLLCFIYGLPTFFQMIQNFSLGDRFGLPGIIVVAAILATAVGFIVINIAAALLYWTGKWIGGTGTYQQIRAAEAWSNVPSIVNIAIWFINMAVFGDRIFKNAFVETPFAGHELGLIFFTAVVQVVIAVWTFIILLKALSEVQGFSLWKSFFNMVLPSIVIFIALLILAWLFSGVGTSTPHQMK